MDFAKASRVTFLEGFCTLGLGVWGVGYKGFVRAGFCIGSIWCFGSGVSEIRVLGL